jgi:DNA polymerase I-like protein with 3'-5' exonuclease and polymerase domains
LFKIVVVVDDNIASFVLNKLNDGKPTMCDIETENLSGILTEKRKDLLRVTHPDMELTGIRLLQLFKFIPNEDKVVYIIDLDYVSLDVVKKGLLPLHTVWAGAYFDFGCLGMVTSRFDDIQLLARTAYPQLPAFSLDILTKYLIKQDLYKDLDKKDMQKQGFKKGQLLTRDQLKYSAVDVYALGLLWTLKKIQETREKPFYKLDMEVLGYTIEFQQNGALVDVVGVQKELDKMPSLLAAEESVLKGLNSKSPKQCKAAFTELLGQEPLKTDKPFLVDMISKYRGKPLGNLAEAIFNNRRSRLRVTNLENLLIPRVVTRFNPYGTVTGRYSSSGKDIPNGINFQNITRNLQYLLEQDTEDTVVIHADYSTAELRAGCSIMQELNMREHLLNKVDLHKVSAMLADTTITKLEDVSKIARQKGKAVSFGFIFGMSAERFREYAYTDYNVVFTVTEAIAVKRAYQMAYPSVTLYHKVKWNNYKTDYVESPMGRLNKPRLGTDAINYSTQSCIGETCKIAVANYIRADYDKHITYMYSQIHDALLIRVPKDQWKEQTFILVKSMLDAWDSMLEFDMLKFKDIPMEVEFMVLGKEIKIDSLESLKEWYNAK